MKLEENPTQWINLQLTMKIPFFGKKKAVTKVGANALWDAANKDAVEEALDKSPATPENIVIQGRKEIINPTPTEVSAAVLSKAESRKIAMQKAEEIFSDEKKPRDHFGIRTVKVLQQSVEDRFSVMNETIQDVCKGNLTSLVIYGTAGIGKSHSVKKALEENNLEEGKDWTLLTSKCTPAALYETALRYRHEGNIIILDDVNFEGKTKGKDMWELVKAMTDTYPTRTVASATKGSNMELVGSPDEAEDFLKKQKGTKENKIPTMFGYRGRLIVITNLPEKFFDDAYLSRSVTVPLFLTESEKIEHMRNILRDIQPQMDLFLKEEVLNALKAQHEEDLELNRIAGTENLSRTQFDLRTLGLALEMAERDTNWRKRLHLL